MEIEPILAEVVEMGASDLHLVSWNPPIVRMHGRLQPMDLPQVAPKELHEAIMNMLSDAQKKKLATELELDLSLQVREVGRFRVNVHRQRGCTEAAFRVVSDQIRSLAQLGMSPVVEQIARKDQGLVLITGPTGSGKSTTMAAMVDQINNERPCMIITIEDPIEYTHRNKKSIIKQREVGHDTRGFSTALRQTLRQDPDVIVVGEMRDLDTISTALTAAETGHLVMATIHTPDVVQTVDRVIDVFPSHQQNQVRLQFANTIQAIIAQQLLPVPGGRGRVVATEILIGTHAVRQILRSAKTEQLVTTMQTATDQGMMTMDKSLKLLYQKGLISYDDALSKSRFPEAFEHI